MSEVLVIEPCKRRVPVSEIWTSWREVRVLALRDFKVRYKQAALGPLWLVIQPLGILGAFTVVFGDVADVNTGDIPYALFAVVGVTVWTFAAQVLGFGVRAHTMNQKLIKLVPSSRVAFVTANVVSSLPFLAVPFLLTLAAVYVAGRSLPVQALVVPALVVWLCAFLWGTILALSSVNVRFRDVGAAVPFVLQGALFLTPLAYPLTETGGTTQTLLALNPLTGILEAWRWSLLGSVPDNLSLAVAGAWTVLFLFAGWRIFTRLEPRFADVI